MSTPESNGLQAIATLDRLIHEPARLMVLSLLYVLSSADFIFVMNQTGLTWGNLSAHLSKLEKAGYVELEKSFRGKRPHTMLRLTPDGRAAFQRYTSQMRQLLDDLPDD